MSFKPTEQADPAQFKNMQDFNKAFEKREDAFFAMKNALESYEVDDDFSKAMSKAQILVDLAKNILDKHEIVFDSVEEIYTTEQKLRDLDQSFKKEVK